MLRCVNGNYYEMLPEEIELFETNYKNYLNSKEGIEAQIENLKQKLDDTDYIICKISEGVATKEEYQTELLQRQEWREKINELELKLKYDLF